MKENASSLQKEVQRESVVKKHTRKVVLRRNQLSLVVFIKNAVCLT